MPSNVLFLPLLSHVPNGFPLAVSLTGSFISLYSHSISLLSTKGLIGIDPVQTGLSECDTHHLGLKGL